MTFDISKMAAHTIPPVSNHYFSIDDILTTQEKVPCVTKTTFPGLGYLDQSTNDKDLTSGTKIEFPLWIAQSFRNMMTLETPKPYREGYRQILSADPNVVDLHRLGPHYYAFGRKLLKLELLDVEDIGTTLMKTFQGRLRYIMDSSLNALNVNATEQTSKLDEDERQLFAAGQKSLYDLQKWESRETEKLSTSVMVANLRKRKRIDITLRESS